MPDALTRYARRWGATADEDRGELPCDSFVRDADSCYTRAVDVAAPAAVVYRWLGQLRVAPYSYDWIDNFGRRSPPDLTDGLAPLATGQRVMTIFTLVAFSEGAHITILLTHPRALALFGEVAVTYAITERGPRQSRLVAKVRVRYPPRGVWSSMRLLLPWGDLIMMRKQLLTLKKLAERTASVNL